MEIELLRDVTIIVSGVVATLVAVLVAVIFCSIYRRVNSILKYTETAAKKIEALTLVTADEIGKPLIRAAGIIQGVACGIRAVSKIFKRGG